MWVGSPECVMPRKRFCPASCFSSPPFFVCEFLTFAPESIPKRRTRRTRPQASSGFGELEKDAIGDPADRVITTLLSTPERSKPPAVIVFCVGRLVALLEQLRRHGGAILKVTAQYEGFCQTGESLPLSNLW